MKKLGKAIVSGREATENLSYADVSEWYSTIIGYVALAMHDVDYSGIGLSKHLLSFRVKTIETLRDKLIARHGLQIDHIHDIMGLRVTADMTLDMQDMVVQRICDVMPVTETLDMRERPHSGYRAVHVIIRLPNGAYAEIQVRTLLQDIWANCFEETADMFGRAIRYGGKPIHYDNGLVDQLLEVSNLIHLLELQLNEISKNRRSAPYTSEVKGNAVEILQTFKDDLSQFRDKPTDNS